MNTTSYVLGIVAAALILIVVFDHLRRGRMRERHAVWWIAAGFASLLLSIFPGFLERIARLAGIEIPLNLVFFGGIAVLFLVSLQHSGELTRLENQTRILAERLALLELEVAERDKPTKRKAAR